MNKQYIILYYIIISILLYIIIRRYNYISKNYNLNETNEANKTNKTNKINRSDFIDKIDKNKVSLEIGALNSPIINPKVYNNVYFLDVFDKNTLIEKQKNNPLVDPDSIVDVDFIWSGQKYNELITHIKFDQVLSSHNIEHQPDLIRYLKNISSILKPNGLVYLVIPDKRYCFDHFRSESNIIDILSAHIRKDTKPQLASLLDERIKRSHTNSIDYWNDIEGENDENNVDNLIAIYNEYKYIYQNKTNEYIDAHVWKFTPDSFIKNINMLKLMKLIDLNIISCSDTEHNSNEFFTILQKI